VSTWGDFAAAIIRERAASFSCAAGRSRLTTRRCARSPSTRPATSPPIGVF